MTAKKTGLGRNLNMLLGQKTLSTKVVEPAGSESVQLLNIDQLQRGQFQPRMVMESDTLQELADSIKSQGILQPIIGRRTKEGIEIIAGERRWRAAKLAGLTQVPVILRDMDDKTTMALALVENMQREDLNAMEEAKGLSRLLEEFDLTHQQIADAVGKSRASVSNLLRMLQLNPDVQRLLENGDIEFGHAKLLLGLTGPLQSEAAKLVVAQGLSVRATESLIHRLSQKPKNPSKPIHNPNIANHAQALGERLAAKVDIQQTTSGKGKIVIHYRNAEQLAKIVEKVSVE